MTMTYLVNFKTIIILTTVVFITEAGFKDALKNIKNKASQLYKNKFGKDKSWHFLGQDLTEYPGTNEKYLEVNKQKWDVYYECLNTQDKNLGNQLSVIPEAIVAFEGSNIKLECKICISPQEQENTDAVIWHWASDVGEHLEPVQFTEHIYESPDDKTLHLYNLQMENTGQYMCNLGESLTPPYFLTIVTLSDKEMIEVHPTEAPMGPHPTETQIIEDHNLILDTEWGEWSTCSKCDDVGRRHKLGYCIVFLKDYYQKSTSKNNESEIATPEDKKPLTIKDIDLELFNVFQFGIPCNSHILPKSIQSLPQVEDRKNEIMTGYCNIKCPKNEVFVVKDRNGKVIEEANNTAGIYSLLQSLPPLEPPVERRLEFGVKGKTVILTCPGNMNSDSPLQWQIGNKNLVAELISRESKGRIFISITDRIHISQARISDSNIYSCWQQKELVGTIRLVVEKKFQMSFSHHIMLLGIVVILSIFLYVFVKAFIGRKYAKIYRDVLFQNVLTTRPSANLMGRKLGGIISGANATGGSIPFKHLATSHIASANCSLFNFPLCFISQSALKMFY